MELQFFYFLSIIAFVLPLHRVNGSGQISMKLIHYTNPGGKGDNGNCCDGFGILCKSYCDHFFKFCVDFSDGPEDNTISCPLGSFTTDVTEELNEINFGDTIGNQPNNIEINFENWTGSILLKVVVWDKDEGNDDDLVDLLHARVTKPSNLYNSTQYSQVSITGRTRLVLSMAVTCDRDWHGPSCNIYCNPSGGNYDCGTDGNKICHPGWEGNDCSENIDECASSPCANGECKDFINLFSCVCNPGFTGLLCEENIDECASDPCANSGQCRDLENGFICHCPHGYSGLTCEINVNECDSNPCINKGQCQDNINGFTCICLQGFSGAICETRLGPGPCSSNPCEEESTCLDEVDTYTCMCPKHRKGRNCEVQLPHICEQDPCLNGGQCIREGFGHTCRCPNQYYGIKCERIKHSLSSNSPKLFFDLTFLVTSVYLYFYSYQQIGIF